MNKFDPEERRDFFLFFKFLALLYSMYSNEYLSSEEETVSILDRMADPKSDRKESCSRDDAMYS